MATILFVILHFLGYTEGPNEWYTFCTLLAIDTVSASILITGMCNGLWKKERKA